MSMSELSGVAEQLALVLMAEAALAAVTFLLLLPLTVMVRRRWPALAFWLGALVLLRLVTPVDLASPISLRAAADRIGGLEAALPPVASASRIDSAQQGFTVFEPVQLRSSATREPSRLWVGLGVAWLMGVSMRAWRFARSRRRARVTARAAIPVTDSAILTDWQASLHVRRAISLLVSDSSTAPFTIGMWRPRIIIPRELLYKHSVLESVIAHEIAHIARFDDLWLILQRAIQALHFFNPFAWMAGAEMDDCRERACDAVVLSTGKVPPLVYGRALLAVASGSFVPVPGTAAVWNPRDRLVMRVRGIADGTHSPRAERVSRLVAMFIGCLCLPLASPQVIGAATPVLGTAAVDSVTTALVIPRAKAAVASPLVPTSSSGGVWCAESHEGIDFRAVRGAAVRAADNGVVVTATAQYERDVHSGAVVILRHSERIDSFYAHLDTVRVLPGQVVRRGDVIATAGMTGTARAPHLHFEIWNRGVPETRTSTQKRLRTMLRPITGWNGRAGRE